MNNKQEKIIAPIVALSSIILALLFASPIVPVVLPFLFLGIAMYATHRTIQLNFNIKQ